MTENTNLTAIDKNRKRVRWIAKTGILAAVSIVLMYLEIMLPFMPSFLKFDFSEIAVLLASFSMGPLTGILIELIKNIAHFAIGSESYGVGELANFLVGSIFVGTAGLIYKKFKSRKAAFMGMATGTLTMTIAACLINYVLVIPFYLTVMGYKMTGGDFSIIWFAQAAGNTLVTDLPTLILWVFVPFNLFKGIVVSLIVGLIYKRVSPLLHK